MMATYTALNIAEIKAAFELELQAILLIISRPTLAKVLRVLKHLCRCARKIKSQLGPLGYLFVALDAVN